MAENWNERTSKKDAQARRKRKDLQKQIVSPGSLMTVESIQFAKRRQADFAVSCELCGSGGLPITIIPRNWFRNFPSVVQPFIKNICYRAILKIRWNDVQFSVQTISFTRNLQNPVVTIHYWTAQNKKPYLGWSGQFIDSKNTLRVACIFLIELKPPNAPEKVRKACEKAALYFIFDIVARSKLVFVTSFFGYHEQKTNILK